MDTAERTGTTDTATYDAFISYSHAADGLLAPRLQSALQRFAKPWWRRRALRVFRDESSLSANPHLWSSITAALDSSGWFVLLLSPDAAESPWVNQEIEYWKEQKDPARILPVLTDGTFEWASGDVAGTAVPAQLRGTFSEEPRWVDMRFARDEMDLDLKDPRFADAVADIASALQDVPKDELASEEVQQHRRTIRTAWAAGILVLLLGIAAVFAAVQASRNAQEAEAQRSIAQQQRDIAETEAERAVAAESLARSRELAASAINVLDDDPELSILLGLEAIDAAPAGADLPLEAVSALREAVHTSRLRNRIPVSEGGGHVSLALSPDDMSLAVAIEADAVLRLYDLETWEVIWEYAEADTTDSFYSLAFSPTGDQLALGVIDSSSFHATPRFTTGGAEDDGSGARVVLLEAESGTPTETLEFGPCPSLLVGPYSPDGRHLPVSLGTGAACDDQSGEFSEGWRTELLDTATLEETAAFPTTFMAGASWSRDGSRLAVTGYDGQGVQVVDMSDESVIATVPGVFIGELSPDGSRVASFDFAGGYGINIHDVETGERVDKLTGLIDFATDIRFSAEGHRLIASSQGRDAAVWNLSTGELQQSLPVGTEASSVALNETTERAYLATGTDITEWDLSGTAEGELDSVATGHWVQANSITTNGDFGAFTAVDTANPTERMVRPFDATTSELADTSKATYMGTAPAVLPDGRIVLGALRGPDEGTEAARGGAVVWNPADDSTTELIGCWITLTVLRQTPYGEMPQCEDGEDQPFGVDRALTNPQGTTLLLENAIPGVGEVRLFDAETLEPGGTLQLPKPYVNAWLFGGEWILVSDTDTSRGSAEQLAILELDSGEQLVQMVGGKAAISRDGALVAVSSAGAVTVYESAAWEERATVGGDGTRVRGLEFSPDGSKLMTATTDNFVRVWDTTDGSELARIPLTGPSDGHWLDESHIVVGTSEGLWTTLTLNVEELRQLAASRLTRGFTTEECNDYRIDPCPTDEQ